MALVRGGLGGRTWEYPGNVPYFKPGLADRYYPSNPAPSYPLIISYDSLVSR